MTTNSAFRLLSLLPFLLQVYGANDWNTPCLNGVCQYSITSTNGGSSGTLKIWGSNAAISDITSAAGWEILDCSPDKLAQDIRLVCGSEDTEGAGCSHLYEEGAENKIVRLPESCGKSAFARVAKAWTPEDQSIPSKLAARVIRRDDKQPTVRALTLDTDFAKTDTSKWGPVNFAIQGANFPGQDVNGTTIPVGPQRRSRFQSRTSLMARWNSIAISDANEFDVNKNIDLPPINVNQNFNIFRSQIACGPVNADVSADVFADANALVSLGVAAIGTIAPPKIDDFQVVAGINADLDGTLSLTANLGGTLDSGDIKIFQVGIPGLTFPGILEVGPTFEINARATASLDVNMDLTVGLTYQISDAQFTFPAKANDKTKGDFKLGDTPLQLSVSPSVQALGTIEASLIPELRLGVSALNDIVSAAIFLRADASASLELDLAASASRVITKGANNAGEGTAAGSEEDGEVVDDSGEEATPRTVTETLTSTVFVDPTPTAKGSSAKATETKALRARQAKKSSDKKSAESATATATADESTETAVDDTETVEDDGVADETGEVVDEDGEVVDEGAATGNDTTVEDTKSFGGCFKVLAGLNVNAGAEGSFFSLFDDQTIVPLFNKNFELFKKCFGDQADQAAATPARRSIRGSRLRRSSLERRQAKNQNKGSGGLQCLKNSIEPAPLVNEKVKGSQAKAV
ncbi:hypothetical protein Moror_1814 [Moniliophthora roreri MCA 2997]|uniref:DUF7223 domain-containing protein n=1 Tax=Moniliophthora roreri (strain MCA 2997) TaxID=1381753 RepID=V2X2Q9_MONRO|nr:hypothetical protein Moror_1814 [Moniliophthora roreri MCA 2997]